MIRVCSGLRLLPVGVASCRCISCDPRMTELTTVHADLSRRSFLTMLAAVPLTARRSPIIDTHLHAWTNDTRGFPFAHPYDVNFKPPAVAGTVEMSLEEMDRHGIDGAVLVQVIYYGWDNRYLA